MPASTNLLADIATVISNGPTANTLALAINPSGPIMDYAGCCKLIQLKFQEIYQLVGLANIGPGGGTSGLIGDTDSTVPDPNLAYLVSVQHVLNGGSSPTATAITTMETVISNGPSSLTQAKAIAPGGEIADYLGNCNLVLTKFEEAKVLLGGTAILGIKQDTDGSDPSLTTINNILTTLS